MVIAILTIIGLCFGSFVNALVWRLHEGRDWVKERSECVHCHHELAAKDLVPLFSWLWLRGKCRYCRKPISAQYPLVEAAMALLYVASYVFWPVGLQGLQVVLFGLWLALLIGLMALLVYDIRWMLLPNKLVFPLWSIGLVFAAVRIVYAPKHLQALLGEVVAVAIGGGIFYLLFQVSSGRWIGGGDVKLGFLLGSIAGTPARAVLFIFLASILGSAISVPLLASKRLKRGSVIPFGPFLISGLILTQLFGGGMLLWYQQLFLPYTL